MNPIEFAPTSSPVTATLQKAIDRLSNAGGGTLRLLPGLHLSGIHLPAYGLVTAFTEDLVIENFRAIPAEGEVRPARHDA